jgi:AcrR family transcriptional regulator
MVATSEIDRQILDAAVRVFSAHPWPKVALAEIARDAGVSIAEVYRHYRSRLAVLAALHHRVDLEMLAAPVDGGPIKDRLFDLLMRRFDALAPLKPAFRLGIAELRKGRLGTLEPALVGAMSLRCSMACVLDAVGLTGACLLTEMRIKVLGTAYLAAFRVWLDDDSVDLARTMASLDKALKRALPLLCGGGATPETPSSDLAATAGEAAA